MKCGCAKKSYNLKRFEQKNISCTLIVFFPLFLMNICTWILWLGGLRLPFGVSRAENLRCSPHELILQPAELKHLRSFISLCSCPLSPQKWDPPRILLVNNTWCTWEHEWVEVRKAEVVHFIGILFIWSKPIAISHEQPSFNHLLVY